MEPSSSHFLSGKSIIIAGAGMAGLSFVAALHKHWDSRLPPPRVSIYERDTEEVSVGREGYSLSINGIDKDGGLYTLMQLGLLDRTLAHAIIGMEGTGCFKVWTEDWKELISIRQKPVKGLPTSTIRIARKNLRRILVDTVSEVTQIEWGESCVSATRLEDNRVRVQIVDSVTGETHDEECDLLIAADGSSSKIRAALRPDDKLQYAGAVQMGGLARFDGPLPPPVDLNWGGVLTKSGSFVFFSPVSKSEIVWALSVREKQPRGPFNNKDLTQ
ncbi:uncharacterized protein JN550_012556 [Neoarthrinium moseri]|nr:uncharacterized protein JN550_012556 [Neoarthrinium moseri]KAI1858509.1 hypothetical protein JN550_012556 [Neoarthrinium moseri]